MSTNVKELIKPGMVIVTEERGKYFVVELNGNILLLNNKGFNKLGQYADNGTTIVSAFNIKEIRRPNHDGCLSDLLETFDYEIVWKRENVIYLSDIISSNLIKSIDNTVIFVDNELVMYRSDTSNKIVLKNNNILYTSDGIGIYKTAANVLYLPEKTISIPETLNVKKIIKKEYGINIFKIFEGVNDSKLFWNIVEGSEIWESPHIYSFTKKYLAEYFNVSEDSKIVVDC